MSDDLDENKNKIKDQFGTGKAEGDDPVQPKDDVKPYAPKDNLPRLFAPEEFDIYINKVTLQAYIFHGKVIDYTIERLDYDPEDHSVVFVMKDGTKKDLGGRIQWLIREYWEKLDEIAIVRTKDGESVDGTFVPIKNIAKSDNKVNS